MNDVPPRTILIVEDEFLIRMMLAETLVDEGFDVAEAGTATDGIALMQRNAGIVLLITDLTLPGSMDGMGLAQWVRRFRPDLPIIYVTGRPDSITRDMLRPRDVVVAKPYLPSEIATAALRMLTVA
jgi:DNA-binding response OmpR family regulator